MFNLTCIIRVSIVRAYKEIVMFNFNPGSFSDLSETTLGKCLWEFLNRKDSIIRLETATSLRRPAVEGLQPQLLENFGEEIKEDRFKQMIGRMVRQIMEYNGYSLDQTGVRIRPRLLFSSASRYRKNT